VARAVGVNVHRVAIVFVAIMRMAIVLVGMSRPKTVIVVGEAVRCTGAVTEGKSGSRCQYAKQVEEGDRARHPAPCSPGQPNEHQPLPSTNASRQPSPALLGDIYNYSQDFEHGKTLPRTLGKTPIRVDHPVTVDGTGGLTEGSLELT